MGSNSVNSTLYLSTLYITPRCPLQTADLPHHGTWGQTVSAVTCASYSMGSNSVSSTLYLSALYIMYQCPSQTDEPPPPIPLGQTVSTVLCRSALCTSCTRPIRQLNPTSYSIGSESVNSTLCFSTLYIEHQCPSQTAEPRCDSFRSHSRPVL